MSAPWYSEDEAAKLIDDYMPTPAYSSASWLAEHLNSAFRKGQQMRSNSHAEVFSAAREFVEAREGFRRTAADDGEWEPRLIELTHATDRLVAAVKAEGEHDGAL